MSKWPERDYKEKKYVEAYGAYWEARHCDLEIEVACIRKGGEWLDEHGRTCGLGLFHHYRELQHFLWPDEDDHRWSDLILKEILQNTITVLMGPKDCISGDTKILNPLTGEEPTIKELCESNTAPVVMTLNGPEKASVPWVKGVDEMFEITCDNGKKIRATGKHVLLTSKGYAYVSSLQIGQRLFGYDPVLRESIQEFCPSTPSPDVFRSSQTIQGSRFGYHSSLRFCDEQLRFSITVCQGVLPLLYDAPKPLPVSRRDDRDRTPSHNRAFQHGDHLSSLGFSQLASNERNQTECLPSSEIVSHDFDLFRLQSQYRLGERHLSAFSKQAPDFFHRQSERDELQTVFVKSIPTPLSDKQSSVREWKESLPPSEHIDVFGKVPESDFQFQESAISQSLTLHDYRVQEIRVQSIKSLGRQKFYDLTVPNAHHYFAEGFISHNSGKTHGAAKYALMDYFCFPEETLIIISSTDMVSLERRVWGDMKGLFQRAKERFPMLPGVVIDAKHTICTDDLNNKSVKARDLRRGCMCVPCKKSSGGMTNIASYVGAKQKRRRYIADEFQFMEMAMFDSLGNVNAGDFKMVALGNPIGQDDPLDKIAEPKGGWESLGEITKTATWENKLFLNSRTTNLVGTDSPNFEFPQDEKPRYWYLINKDSIERTVAGYGKDSSQYWSQCVGIRRPGLTARRVLTQAICEAGRAFEEVTWDGTTAIKKVGGLDAAYGGTGGDRCPTGYAEFGKDVEGRSILNFHPPVLVPVSVRFTEAPETQIAKFVKNFCESNGVSPDNFGYDSTGRGSLGLPLARFWADSVNAIEFGGKPTKRPVTLDMYIYDPSIRARRLMTCEEHYSKFVSELWYSMRYAIEAGQVRGLPKNVAEEFYKREWKLVAGNKVEIESKKEMKERTGYSPDLADWAAVCLEMARRKGFQISKLANASGASQEGAWLRKWSDESENITRASELIEA